MDFLKAEIERKKRLIQEKNVMQPEKKYFKRGDLAAVQEREYLEKYSSAQPQQPEQENQTKEEKEKKEEEKKAVGAGINDHLYPLPRKEVVRRLRDVLQPILLFGESEDEANLRLRSLDIMGDNDKLGGTSQNDYREAMKRVDKQYMKAMEKDNEEDDKRSEFKIYNTDRTYENLLDLANDMRMGDLKHDDLVISEWIKIVMTMWGNELNSRSESDKMSVKGKMEAVTYNQTQDYLKPLLKLLKKNKLSDDIRDSLSNVVKYILQRDYILANERYMEMAIGNAPWPIGVTNAGIHARPGRERIFSKHVAHVLNDESQRKYIQGLKRLMSKSQQYFKTDPSRSVDFIRDDDK